MENWIPTLHIVDADAKQFSLRTSRQVGMVYDCGTECAKGTWRFDFMEREIGAANPMGTNGGGDCVFGEFGWLGVDVAGVIVVIVGFVAVGEVDEEEEEDTED